MATDELGVGDKAAIARSRRFVRRLFLRTIAGAAILLVLAVLGIYSGFRRLSVREITDRTVHTLQLTERVFSSLHGWAVPSMLDLMADPVVRSAISIEDPTVVHLTRAAYRIQNTAANNPLIHSIYLYNPSAEIVLSTTHGVERGFYSDETLIDMINMVGPDTIADMIPRLVRSEGPRELDRVLTLVFYDQVYNRGPTEGCLVVNLDESRLRRNFLGERDVADGRIMVVDRNGIALSHHDPERFGTQVLAGTPLESIAQRPESITTERLVLDGSPVLVVMVADEDERWRMISVTNEDWLTAALREFRNGLLFVFFLASGGALIVAFLAARQISAPIQRVSEHARALSPAARIERSDDASDEVEYLDSVLQRLGDRVAELSRFIESHGEAGQKDALRRLIGGSIPDPEAIREELPSELIAAEDIRVVAIRLDRYRGLIEAVDGPTIRSMRETIAAVVLEAFQPRVRWIDFGRDHGVVLHIGDVEEEKIFDAYRSIIDRVQSTLRCTITVGIGSVVFSFEHVSESYQAAREATDYRFTRGHGRVILSSSLHFGESRYRFPHERVRRVVEELRLGHADEAATIVDEILEETGDARYDDFLFALESLLRAFRREFVDRSPPDGEVGPEIRDLSDQLESIETIRDARDAFRQAITRFVRSVDVRRQRRAEALVKRVEKLIDEQVTDVRLNADMIADVVGLSTNYLRDLFHQVHGVSLSRVILRKRIDYARTLLLQTDLPVREIAEAAGFQNTNYFYTLFRRETGRTPREFRRESGRNSDPS